MDSSCCVKILISIILGAIFGILVGASVVTIAAPILFALILILSVLFLIAFIAIALLSSEEIGRCFCRNTSCLLLGIIGGILFSVIALVISTVTVVLTGVFVFLAVASFLLELLGLKSLLICIAGKKCCI